MLRNKFLRRDPKSILARLHRQFDFHDSCIYAALTAGSDQIEAIADFTKQFGQAIYYLLYNPPMLPACIRYRVFTVADIDRALAPLPQNTAPMFKQVSAIAPSSEWRLEHWAADLLLTCQVGR